MPQCSVPECSKQGGHKFPEDVKLRKAWVLAIKRSDSVNKTKLWTPAKHARVCHLHFKETDFHTQSTHGKISIE